MREGNLLTEYKGLINYWIKTNVNLNIVGIFISIGFDDKICAVKDTNKLARNTLPLVLSKTSIRSSEYSHDNL